LARVRAPPFVAVAAAALLAGGAALLFAPDALGLHGPTARAVGALYGAALLGLGAAAWVARAAPLGGIYGRALVVGQFAHALVGALALVRPALAGEGPLGGGLFWGALALYAGLTVGWGRLLLGAGPRAPSA
jgi:hypothetical protein